MGSDGRLNLLDVPYHRLIAQVEQEDKERALEQSRRADMLAKAEAKAKLFSKDKPLQKVMWVDKYRPTKFTELLGEERSHRDVLSWLKEWDKCVFKTVAPNQKKRSRLGQQSSTTTDFAYHDALGRPKERVSLSCSRGWHRQTTQQYALVLFLSPLDPPIEWAPWSRENDARAYRRQTSGV